MTKKMPWSVDTAAERLALVIQRINNNDACLNHVFTQTFFDQAQQQCAALDAHSRSALGGSLVSVKDLFDVAGFVTRAGTTFMAADAAAKTDAPPIKYLKEAGAILIGHTNMTELAYSGLGLNPHYGTPENALIAGCIPGGSTSGGAVSVAQGVADIAIGTDTGGSVRIPAAFNGIVGFKPSQNTVSRKGCKALSRSLDSIGPLAKTVSACELAYKTMLDNSVMPDKQVDPVFFIPTNYGMDDLQSPVAAAFNVAVQKLKNAGYKVEHKAIAVLDELKTFPVWHFASIESRAEYELAYQNNRDMMDPRIVGPTRMGRADEVDAVGYRQTLNVRQHLIEQYQTEMGNNILLLPTVPIMPPSFESMQSDEAYTRTNIQVLRNTSIANVMDCCSISLPVSHSEATIGVMMTASNGHDLSLLSLASKCEAILETNSD